MDPLDLAARFGTAFGLGVLVGLERERARREDGTTSFAGVRTFALLALLGATAGHLGATLPWMPVAGLLAVAALTVASWVVTARAGDLGSTTEVGALYTYLLGVLCAAGQLGLATALAVAALLLLSMKGWSHELARHIEAADVEATLKFAIVTVIVLPLLPDRTFGPPPLDVVNLHRIWLMVVLISGLDFASYVLVKVLGAEHGLGLSGVLGGLVSSTAVTLGFAQRSREDPALAGRLALGIVVAWTVMFARVLVAVAVISPDLARRLGVGIGIMGATSAVLCLVLRRSEAGGQTSTVKSGANPFELTTAVKFGLLFGAVTFLAKAAELALGDAGLYLAGAVAGTTDVDAIALSMADLARTHPDTVGPAARTVLIAVLSNTVVKASLAAALGAPELRRRIVPAAAALLATGALAAFFIG